MIIMESTINCVTFGPKFKEKLCLQKTERARVQEVLRLLRIGVPIMTVSEIASGGWQLSEYSSYISRSCNSIELKKCELQEKG